MATTHYAPGEVVRRGQDLYERNIRARVEPENKGKMLAIDVDSGEYSLADDSLTALDQIKAKSPDASVYILRVGFPTAVKIGAGRGPKSS
ncbi:MAG: hypothetical protein WD894_15750 [Pirellulales bacterium]